MCNDDQKVITLGFWSVESFEEEVNLFRMICTFSWALNWPWFSLLFFLARNIPVIRENGDCHTVTLVLFQLLGWLKWRQLSGDLPKHLGSLTTSLPSPKIAMYYHSITHLTKWRKKNNLLIKKGKSLWPLFLQLLHCSTVSRPSNI